ncbi:hypothetical protein BDV3_002591 [Batrachochytrium dendrobatidis]
MVSGRKLAGSVDEVAVVESIESALFLLGQVNTLDGAVDSCRELDRLEWVDTDSDVGVGECRAVDMP